MFCIFELTAGTYPARNTLPRKQRQQGGIEDMPQKREISRRDADKEAILS
jgi:hypothetical protein